MLDDDLILDFAFMFVFFMLCLSLCSFLRQTQVFLNSLKQ